ncbi:MAG TPA: WYL domain-containing transcriptional regulator [Flavobacteriaceae bacterium]|nr:WYL domain-containing transcriptional regulator [Flavobacteriaceae bacterium]
MSQYKLSKLLRLLMLLNGSRNYSKDELMERFDMAESSVYRYLNTFEEAGFLLNRRNGRYNLKAEEKNVRELNKLFHFSDEEAFMLYETISHFEKSSSEKEKLLKKLHTLYDFGRMAEFREQKIELIGQINSAMEGKRQLILLDYRSSNSGVIGNRTVEPFRFIDDYAAVWCFDVEKEKIRQFRLARIGGTQLLVTTWKNEILHQMPFTDAFRLSASKPIATVKAVLSLKGYNLLTEEYPLSKKHISSRGELYLLELPIAGFEGIGRFVLGLPGEIHVEGPSGFLDYLEKKRKKFGALSFVDSKRG